MKDDIKISIPEGYTLDPSSTSDQIILKRSLKLNVTYEWLVRDWLLRKSESVPMYYIYKQSSSPIEVDPSMSLGNLEPLMLSLNKSNLGAIQALARLLLLRDYYNDGWRPNWDDPAEPKYCVEINKYNQALIYSCNNIANRLFHFKTEELARTFMNNYSADLNKYFYLYYS